MLLMWGFETTAQLKKVMVPPSMHHLSHFITLFALKNMNVHCTGTWLHFYRDNLRRWVKIIRFN